jgi:hypothetical protein
VLSPRQNRAVKVETQERPPHEAMSGSTSTSLASCASSACYHRECASIEAVLPVAQQIAYAPHEEKGTPAPRGIYNRSAPRRPSTSSHVTGARARRRSDPSVHSLYIDNPPRAGRIAGLVVACVLRATANAGRDLPYLRAACSVSQLISCPPPQFLAGSNSAAPLCHVADARRA